VEHNNAVSGQSTVPRISVIIPAINEVTSIRHAVDSAWQAGADEVIVADGGSSDGTQDIAAEIGARVVSSDPGRALQQNMGAATASGDLLIFLHADSLFATGAFAPLKRERYPKLGAFRQKIDSQRWAYRLVELGNDVRARLFGLPYGDQAIFVSAELFHAVGGFPETRLLEDYILMRKLRWHSWPKILRTLTTSSARRWEKRGIARQTLLNWRILFKYEFGVSPNLLAAEYRRHDQP